MISSDYWRWVKNDSLSGYESLNLLYFNYTIIDLCRGGHGVLLNSKRHIDQRGADVNMIKFTVQ